MWQSSTGLGGHSKQQTIHKMASSWRFPDSEWTHGHDHRHGWALGKQIVPQHVFGEDDENKRGFYMQIGILKVKSLNLGLWLYIIGFLIWVMGPFALALTTYINIIYYNILFIYLYIIRDHPYTKKFKKNILYFNKYILM